MRRSDVMTVRSPASTRTWRVAVQVALAFLLVEAALIGVWATLASRSWFRSFPGLGRHWIAADGPYNHHLAGDVGALFLGLAVITVAALLRLDPYLVRATGLAWVVSGAPHFLYHLTHRAGLGAGDWVVSVGGLGFWVAVGAFVFLAGPRAAGTPAG